MAGDGSHPYDRAAEAAALAVTALTAASAALAPVWDVDVWWILRAGEDLLREGAVARVNRYAFTAPERPWVMHEWAFGALYAALVRGGGVGALALPRLAAVAGVAWATAWRAGRDAGPRAAAVCVALSLGAFGGRFESPRPLGVTWALAAAAAALAFEPAFAWRHALGLGALACAWANLHGSFPLAVALACAGLLVPGGDRRARLAAPCLAAAATLVNPYGASLHGLVARYARGAPDDATALVHARIVEWWPLGRATFARFTPAELAVALALTVASVAALTRPAWRARGAVGLALAAMALAHGRHLQLLGVVGCCLAAPALPRGAASAGRRMPAWAWPCAVALVGGLLLAAVGARRPAGAWVLPTQEDEEVAAALASLPDGARVYVDLRHTGWALWVGWPRVRVFFDARNDCHPAEVLRAGLDLGDGALAPDAALATLRRWGATHVVVRCAAPSRRALSSLRFEARGGVCVAAVAPEGLVGAGGGAHTRAP